MSQRAGFTLDDVAAAVDGDLAAVVEHGADFLAAALDARLRGRQRGSEHFCGLLVREACGLGFSPDRCRGFPFVTSAGKDAEVPKKVQTFCTLFALARLLRKY